MREPALPDRRAKLLDKVADYILRNGLADLSLRPLAAAINTSPRMLLYFFSSKERLITAALDQIRLRQQRRFARAMSGHGGRREWLLAVWDTWSSPGMARFWTLLFEVYGLALQNPERFPGFLEGGMRDWRPLVEQSFATLDKKRAQSLGTLAMAAVRGLQLDVLATGDRARTRAAFQEMLRLFSLAAQPRK
jgi:AcrR family transcriptional regulator